MTDFGIVSDCYLRLLRLSHGVSRSRLQHVLVGLRDEIAYLTNRSAEEVQGEFETLAALTAAQGREP